MSSKIKCIDSIKNMAVFQDFCWDTSCRCKENKLIEFKKLNIIYGRNYSGKTTLSRIFRAMETGILSAKYDTPEFQVTFTDGATHTKKINQLSPKNHNETIRVFNEDFIKENLNFIIDEEQNITSFAILGEENTKVKKEIDIHTVELGSVENKSGITYELLKLTDANNACEKEYADRFKELKNDLTRKASEIKRGGFNEVDYNSRC